VLREKAGRLVWNGFPTGVAVSHAMHHGGPHPATSNPLHTSVGAMSIRRFLRPVAWQDAPQAVLPPELRDAAPGIPRRVDGVLVLE
jgi:NADP-dependent aldehyde dehydrogenase